MSQNAIQVFNFQENYVRTVQQNDETWFVLKDVCDVLEIKNATDTTKRLDDDELTRLNLGGQVGEVNIINESGLYSVILRSDKPNAKPFRKWVTSEVIPSIRKTGSYSTAIDHQRPYIDLLEEQCKLYEQLLNLKEENAALKLQPKVKYVDNEEKKQMFLLFKLGFSNYKIAKMVARDVETVARHINRARLQEERV